MWCEKSIFMKTRVLFFSIFLSINVVSFSQNTFFIGDKSYPCTEEFYMRSLIGFYMEYNGVDFKIEETCGVKIKIVKNETQGFFVISTPVNNNANRIVGKLLIYLEDGTVISCVDRGIYDCVDDITTTVYYLSSLEIQQMKNSDIRSIRFSFKSNNNYTNSVIENYTASFPYKLITVYHDSGVQNLPTSGKILSDNNTKRELLIISQVYVNELVKSLFQ